MQKVSQAVSVISASKISQQRHIFHFSANDLSVGVDAFFSTGYYDHSVEIPYSYQPAYLTGDLNATYTLANAKWSLTAYAHNINNYAVKIATFPATTIGDPRTFGATLGVNWS